jgi:chemotaxis signal transduction protein
MSDATSGPAAVQLAVAMVGAVTVGVPAAAVLQALPLAGALHPLPRRQGALCGVVEHGGRLVPVVDLARWVDVGAPGTPDGHGDRADRILVLGNGSRTIGLRVNAVVGLTDVPAAALARVLHDDDPAEVFHTVVRSDQLDRVLSVLDVDRLIALAAAWHGAPASSAAINGAETNGEENGGADGASARPVGGGVLHALLAVGDTRIAVPATELAEVIRMPELRAIGPAGGSHYCCWRDRNLAVVDIAALLGMPAARQSPLLAIVERGGLALGLIVREALELRAVPCAANVANVANVTNVGAVDAAGASAAPDKLAKLASTTFDADGGAIDVIDTAALFARAPEAALSRVTASAAADPGKVQRLNDGAYVVFQTEQRHATPIAPIEEILALRADHVDSREQLVPTIAWREQPLPVTDLRAPGTPTPPHCGARIIVVRGPAGCTGYVVKQVVLLIPPNTGKLYRMALAGAGLVEFITTGEAAEQVSYRTMDLAHRAALT